MSKRPIPISFRFQWALLLAVLTALACVLVYAQLRMRGFIVADERARLLTLTRAADQLLTVQVRSADAALRTMRDGLDRWRSGDGYAPFAMEHLKRVEKMMPGARTFVVLDAQGRCQLSNRPELVGQLFSQRDYFVQAVAAAAEVSLSGDDVLTVSPPYRTALGVWAVTVSRAVVDGQGSVTGVVAATLSPDYFQTLMHNMGHAPDLHVGRIHDTGQLYVAVPAAEQLMDTSFLQPGTFTHRHRASGLAETVFEGETTVMRGEQRLVAVKNVPLDAFGAQHGFYAVASRSMDVLLTEWRHDNAVMVGVLLSIAMLCAASLRLYQRWVGRLQHRAQLVEAELVASHAKYEQLAHTLPCVLFDCMQHPSGQLVVQFVSPYAQQLLGCSAEALTADPRQALQHVPPPDVLAWQQQHAQALTAQQPYACTVRLLRPNSQAVWVQVSASPSAVAGQPGVTAVERVCV